MDEMHWEIRKIKKKIPLVLQINNYILQIENTY